jgi:hypothetical protein
MTAEEEWECICSCPNCKTFETLWFVRDRLVPTKRFEQKEDGKVYHDCGADEPCLLFPTLLGQEVKWCQPTLSASQSYPQ